MVQRYGRPSGATNCWWSVPRGWRPWLLTAAPPGLKRDSINPEIVPRINWEITMRLLLTTTLLAAALAAAAPGRPPAPVAAAIDGFVPLFNGRDLDGWYGWAIHERNGDPKSVAALSVEDRAKKIAAWT